LIKTSSSAFTIACLPADEFPKIGDIEEESTKLSLNRNIFKDMVRKTAFAASIDESKGIIVGILTEIEADKMSMVALDGFRMAVTREEMQTQAQINFIAPAKILNEINKIIGETDDESPIDLIISAKKAIVLVEDTKVVFRLLEGEFIKYNDIIPQTKQTTMNIERSALLNSIERASLLAKEGKNNLVKFVIHHNLLTITSRSEEGNVKEEVIMEKTGEDIEIGFNSKYMIDVLKAIDDEEVKMEFNTSITPCLVKPTQGFGYEYLILPVRISSNQ
jgi:DNA polymerase-3 subunit beta